MNDEELVNNFDSTLPVPNVREGAIIVKICNGEKLSAL
jgi:hypothetical protein